MPFTISHPAIVIPLERLFPRFFSLTGLMAGSISPDLIYFLQLETQNRGISHSWLGLFIFCIPAAVAFALVFHQFFKMEFIRHLPAFLQKRLGWLLSVGGFPNSVREWSVLLLSVTIGALSHFFWDSWTHGSGVTVQAFPWLLTLVHVGKYHFPIFEILHHTSSLFGGVAVLTLLLQRVKSTSIPPETPTTSLSAKTAFQLGGICSALIFAMLGIWVHGGYLGADLFDVYSRRFLGVTSGLSTWAGYFYFVCVVGLIRRIITNQRSQLSI